MPHSPRAKRTFFISATCLAICVLVYRTVRHYLEWHDVREDLHDWAETLDRERGKTEIYVGPQINEEFFEVLTAEAERGTTPEGTTAFSIVGKPDPSRFHVVPAGKWVTISTVS